jgi:secondary thiamine-phosphate synthase enzyme
MSWLVALIAVFSGTIAGFTLSHSLATPSKSRSCWNPLFSSSPSSSDTMVVPFWFQHEISITAPSRGCHLITGDINKAIGADLKKIQIGMCNIFVQHTSASLTINENADPDVRRDMEVAMNLIVPAQWNRDGTFRHTMEGDDDMPGHVKSSLMGVSLQIPITNGRLALGTWQGIYLNGACFLMTDVIKRDSNHCSNTRICCNRAPRPRRLRWRAQTAACSYVAGPRKSLSQYLEWSWWFHTTWLATP